MMKKNTKIEDSTEAFEKALKGAENKTYILRLYVSGMTPKSIKAIQNLKKICQEHLKGRFELEVIDLYQQPEKGKHDQVIAAPTLIKQLPLPLRKIIGDLSDREKVLLSLDIVNKESDAVKKQ
ncbi:MAG: circadian clock KaiB family protein [Desulfobacterales bacterium]